MDNVNARQIWNLALNLEAPIHSPIARPAGGLLVEKPALVVYSVGLPQIQRCEAAALETVPRSF